MPPGNQGDWLRIPFIKMKRVTIKYIICLTGIIFLLISNPAFPITIPDISANLSQDRIPIGETALLTVSVTWVGEASEFIFTKPQPPECRGLEVIGTYQRGITYRTDGDNNQAVEYLFTLRGKKKVTDESGRSAYLIIIRMKRRCIHYRVNL